jgi:hypothetical protein
MAHKRRPAPEFGNALGFKYGGMGGAEESQLRVSTITLCRKKELVWAFVCYIQTPIEILFNGPSRSERILNGAMLDWW